MIRLAIDRLAPGPVDEAAVDRFLAEHKVPIVEGRACTFLFRGEADEVRLAQRVTGHDGRIRMLRVAGTNLWYAILHVKPGSRLNYQFEAVRGGHVECHNDPLNPDLSRSPVGDSSVLLADGYETPEWTVPVDGVPAGQLRELVLPSPALQRDCEVTLYLPHGMRHTRAYPLLIVHDGRDFLGYSAAKAVLDNLIHRGELAETVVAFLQPRDRLTEYTDCPEHATFLHEELLPLLESTLPVSRDRTDRCVLGSSFGAVATLSAAYRFPEAYGSLILLSGSFVHSGGTGHHGGGPAFDPVVEFVDRFRARPRRVADRVYQNCGIYEPLIRRNRAMRPVLEATGMQVRYGEALDGHTWENWRDRLRDALTWVFPGPAFSGRPAAAPPPASAR
jgi:enterochelin esterase-like enzyme